GNSDRPSPSWAPPANRGSAAAVLTLIRSTATSFTTTVSRRRGRLTLTHAALRSPSSLPLILKTSSDDATSSSQSEEPQTPKKSDVVHPVSSITLRFLWLRPNSC
ncbi:hypothetical protein Drorol1_Dr00006833, partial [Drosera rotundifolia]